MVSTVSYLVEGDRRKPTPLHSFFPSRLTSFGNRVMYHIHRNGLRGCVGNYNTITSAVRLVLYLQTVATACPTSCVCIVTMHVRPHEGNVILLSSKLLFLVILLLLLLLL